MNHIDEYLESLTRKGLSQATLYNNKYILYSFIQYLKISSLDATQKMLNNYCTYLLNKNLSTNTRRMILIIIKSYYTWACRHQKLFMNPSISLEIPKRQLIIPRIPSHTQMLELIRNISGIRYSDIVAKAVLEVFYSTGIRRKELLQLQINDLDLSQSILYIRQGKGGKDRIVPLGRHAKRALRSYLKKRSKKKTLHNCQSLFINQKGRSMNIDNLFTMLKRYRGVVDITPHSIRHLCAVGMLRGGANIRTIQELLGHSNLSSTQIYTHLHIEDLQRMHTQYHPRNSF